MNTLSVPLQSLSPKTPAAYEHALLQLLRIAANTDRPCHAMLTEIAENTSRALDVERVGVWVLADHDQVLRCYHLFERTEGHVFSGTVLRAADFPAYFSALKSQRAIPADDARKDPVTRELSEAYLLPLGITSMLDAPIYSNGKVIGVVCHEDTGPLHDWTDADYAFAAAIADIIARLLAEAKRLQAEDSLQKYEQHMIELHRMEALGRAAANIAHDFRNVLSIVSGFSNLIKNAPDDSAEVQQYAQRIVEASDRGRALTQELIDFSRETPATPRVLDIQKIVESLSSMLKILLGANIRLQIEYNALHSRVLIDAVQLERALVNLVVNARDAMSSGGVITVTLEEGMSEEDDTSDYVVIRVSDTGCGISEAVRERIFEPFFTTKGEHGNGLGLSIVNQIVTRSGGFIHVESELGRGTTMSIFLPRIANTVKIEYSET